ncbi:MAG: holin [Pseudomonadales bacterium]
MTQHFQDGALETVGAAVAAKVTQGGAAAGFLGWVVQVNWIGLTGVLIALAGLAANLYFQHRRDKREEQESKERISSLRKQCGLESSPK